MARLAENRPGAYFECVRTGSGGGTTPAGGIAAQREAFASMCRMLAHVMHRFARALPLLRALCAACTLCAACATAPTQPPGAPPTPQSVTRDEPGGDAADPHLAALRRELTEPWGRRRDKDNQLLVPVADKHNWKRVRYWMVDHFTGFRYGEDGHSLNVVLVQELEPKKGHEGEKVDAGLCLTRAEEWAKPQFDAYGVDVKNLETVFVKWKKTDIPVRLADAHFEYLFEVKEVSAAWASYPAYPDACLIFGIVVPWDGHPEIAKQVRDRWVKEAVRKLKPRTKTRPTRKE